MSLRTDALALLLVAAAVRPVAAQVPAGGNFRVNSTTTGDQVYPLAAGSTDGRFVLVWSDEPTTKIKAQRYQASGQPARTEFTVNEDGVAYDAGAAMGPRGGFVVAWSKIPFSGTDVIAAQRFAPGGDRLGAELLVSTDNENAQIFPGVAVDGRGAFVVVWLTPPRGNGFDVHAQRFDAAGQRLGGEFQVNAPTTTNLFGPSVAAGADGRFLVVWSAIPGTDGSSASVDAQRYDANGVPVGGNFRVNTYTTGAQFAPHAAFTADGGFVIAFSGDQPGAAADVFVRRFAADGSGLGPEQHVNTYTTGAQGIPRVAVDAGGNFVVAWSDYGDGSVALPGLHGRRFTADGAPRGDEFQVNTYTTGRQETGRGAILAGDAAGNFVITWKGDAPGGAGLDIVAQRFGGLLPVALGVDTEGNGVWEAGETASLRPSWRNVNGQAQTFAGTLSAITGPAGATYSIADGSGGYGTVPDGATQACTECYTVSVSQPAQRPALHWDASVLESITPDAQGQRARWSLHVGDSFSDVPHTSGAYRFVETVLHQGITAGCGGNAFCPGAATARGQMAVFVLLAKEGAGFVPPACGTPVFGDVPAVSPFCRYVEELARRGIVNGCGNGNFCPDQAVTREQMAVFLLRTLDPGLSLPPCDTPAFDDVPASSPFCPWIKELARRGITGGCGGSNYCPAQAVTREQMAVFLTATFGLTLYGP